MRDYQIRVVWVLGMLMALGVWLSPAAAQDKIPLPDLDPATSSELKAYLDAHKVTPEAYIVGKFEDHDVVFLGETHCIKYAGELVQRLIPMLRESGVYTLAVEFGRRVDQPLIDSLLAAPAYDEMLAREIVFRQFLHHGMREYVDVFKAAWQANQGLGAGERPLWIVGINDAPDWSYVKTPEDRDKDEIKRKVWHGESERDWAQVIVDKAAAGDKVLVSCGMHHAFTEYRMPIVNQSTGEFIRHYNERAGNYVFAEIGKRAITIALHAPWPSEKAESYATYAVDGVIDALMHELGPEYYPVGFDTRGTPFGALGAGRNCLYTQGYDDLTLADWCDGYVFHAPISQYQGMTPIPDFVNADNLARAQQYTWNPKMRSAPAGMFQLSLMQAANIQWQFRKFH